MAKKSRLRKSDGKRQAEAPAVHAAHDTHKPWQIAAVCFFLVTVTLFAYWGVHGNDFLTYDDLDYVVNNPQVQQGITLHSVAWAFTTFHAINWHPLTWISHMIDWSLYGNYPGGHHLTNVYLHAANAILLFLLFIYLTGCLWRSAMVSFLFALHPAHVESVAWIAERKDVLCAFFWLAALLAYASYLRKPSWKRYACLICASACALMSKPMAVTLPFTLLLLDFWPLHRITFAPEARAQWLFSFWKLCVEKWPLFLMSLISSIITFAVQRAAGAVAESQALPLWERICNAAFSYCRYLWLMVWPDQLRAYYYYDSNHIAIYAALSAAALLLVSAACWHFRRDKPYCLIGWLWFLGTLVPVIGLVQVGHQAMAERYTYVPSIGLFIAVVWLAGDAVTRFPKFKLAAQLLAVAVIVACAIKTDAQVKVWKDTVTLFSHTLAIDPRGAVPNYTLAMAYERQGQTAEAQKYLDLALYYNPNLPEALSYSAFCLMRTVMQTHDRQYLPLAGQRLEQALRITPDDPAILTNMALWSVLMGQPKEEEIYSRKAIAANPDSVEARLYLADALQAQKKLDEAAQQWRQVLAVEPDRYIGYYKLGMILESQGLKQEALKEFRQSLAINPYQAMAHSSAGRILLEEHQLSEAVEEFQQALRFDPANANAHNDLGAALYQLGDYEGAAGQFSDALRIAPSYADARRNLDIAQAQLKSKTGHTVNSTNH